MKMQSLLFSQPSLSHCCWTDEYRYSTHTRARVHTHTWWNMLFLCTFHIILSPLHSNQSHMFFRSLAWKVCSVCSTVPGVTHPTLFTGRGRLLKTKGSLSRSPGWYRNPLTFYSFTFLFFILLFQWWYSLEMRSWMGLCPHSHILPLLMYLLIPLPC